MATPRMCDGEREREGGKVQSQMPPSAPSPGWPGRPRAARLVPWHQAGGSKASGLRALQRATARSGPQRPAARPCYLRLASAGARPRGSAGTGLQTPIAGAPGELCLHRRDDLGPAPQPLVSPCRHPWA